MSIQKTVKRRLLALFSLALILAFTMPPPALAAGWQRYTTSREGIALIKEMEGYSATAYLDNGKWYIGYGVQCDPADYPYGVDLWQAEELMLETLADKEEMVNQLLAANRISVSQQQFDALVSMTYNLGNQWMNSGVRLYNYLCAGIDRYSELEVVNAFATWCHQGGSVLGHVAERRLREAFLFLYGDYNNNGPSFYTYIDFDANGGTLENQTVFYPVGLPYGTLPTPTLAGQGFLGWYTAGGVRLTGDETAQQAVAVTASWTGGGASGGGADYSGWVNPYADVKDTDWYLTYVRELSAKGILAGFPDKTFRPDCDLSAGEAVKLILLAVGQPDPGNAAEGYWGSTYLALAERLGYVGAGEIQDASAPIDRMAIARITARAMGLSARAGTSPFCDVDDGCTLALYEEGVFDGYILGGKRYFCPNETISRAEISAVIVRLSNWEYVEENDPAKSGYIEYYGKRIPVLENVAAAPYDKNLFVKSGSAMYYNHPSYTPALGIDVSRHQGNIDWEKVAASGTVQFAFIRAGGRYAESGDVYADANFEKNLAGARAAGLDVGVYFYSQAITVQEAVEEARFVLDKLGGTQLEYPIVFDWEVYSADARTKGLGQSALTDCAVAFCDTVAAAGYTPMIYVGFEVAYNRLDLSRLTGYDFWFAQYASQPEMYYNYRIWQYSSSGSVPGIEGKVDMDIAFIPY